MLPDITRTQRCALRAAADSLSSLPDQSSRSLAVLLSAIAHAATVDERAAERAEREATAAIQRLRAQTSLDAWLDDHGDPGSDLDLLGHLIDVRFDQVRALEEAIRALRLARQAVPA